MRLPAARLRTACSLAFRTLAAAPPAPWTATVTMLRAESWVAAAHRQQAAWARVACVARHLVDRAASTSTFAAQPLLPSGLGPVPDRAERRDGGQPPQRARSAAALHTAAALAAGAAAASLSHEEAALTVSELKAVLEEAGVDFRDCFEKRELVERLREARARLPPAAAARVGALLQRSVALAEGAPGAAAAAAATDPLSGLFLDEQAAVALFKRCSPSVVNIMTSAVALNRLNMDVMEIPQGAGSGFVWDAAGHVVTNWHVVRDAQRAKVTLADNSTWDAVLVGAEPDKDLAVLKLVGPPGGGKGGNGGGPSAAQLAPIAVGSSAALQVGQRVFAIGNPFGLGGQSLTQGVVSGVGRDIRSITGARIRDVIQSDAAINPGNSGGPLLDSRGRLVGVNTVIYSPSGAFAGVGFAIPVDTVRRVVAQLIRHGRVVRPVLGVHCAADAQARALGLPGVLVVDVTKGGAADAAGVRGTARDARGALVMGDVITAVGAQRVATVEDLLAAVEECGVGEQVEVTVQRDGRPVKLRCRLQERSYD